VGFRDLPDLRRRYAGQAGQLVRDFYVPVLGQATLYDRQSGYFDSATLVQVAAGLAAFIRNVRQGPAAGRPAMRLITGTTWSPDDIDAYRRGLEALRASLERTGPRRLEPNDEECLRLGLPRGWRPEADQIAKDRYGALAWMVAAGLLEVRIALPLDHAGRPCYPGRGGALCHPKAGILSNGDGNVLAFQGSVNETSAAWTRNREMFEVKRSWASEQDADDCRYYAEEFERIWKGHDPGLLVLPLPRAVAEHLRAFTPPDGQAPPHDPMEAGAAVAVPLPQDRMEAQRLLDAPRQPGGAALVLGPLWADGRPFQPFPHQATVYRRAVAEFPQSFLFCDEVGLGKTIEAGLTLRALILRGELRRVLIVAPRNLIRQWMEELREKFALTAWFYDGQMLHDVGGRTRRCDRPWDEDGLVIVSRHLIARQERRAAVLTASHPWDAVLVDEAHAARRRVFGANEPNLLLGLLQEMKRRELFRCLWLLTATPMQLDVQEVHDLLLLAGLDDPRWGDWSRLTGFQDFFDRLREFPARKEARAGVVALTRQAVALGAPDLSPAQVPSHWTEFAWRNLVARIKAGGAGLALALQGVAAPQAEAMTPYLARQTPLAVQMFRHTRQTLRAYKERGLLPGGLAVREPEDVPVAFQTEAEQALYNRIDELCSRFYRLADLPDEERSGVGFLMAVFRKRLASCFYAFRRSLERRRDLIASTQQDIAAWEATGAWQQELAEEEDEEGELDVPAVAERERQRLLRLWADPRRREQLERERAYLADYIAALARVDADGKFEAFGARLEEVLARGHRVIVFTQYLDTLDFIREKLGALYSGRMACYSGRGGEVWEPAENGWRVVDKAEVKARCGRGHPRAIDILLGTDAASEGLNLQQFSALVNYDLPWNPMRVEQRIGRIDRIGQEAAAVQILNLYVQGTIEEDTYFTLKERIGVFEEVVGPLQPILAEMPKIFRKLAQGEIELAEARRQLDLARQKRPPAVADALEGGLHADEPVAPGGGVPAPVTQEQLAAWCLSHPASGMRVLAVPEPGAGAPALDGLRGCLAVTWPYAPPHLGIGEDEEILVTFSGELADRHPPTAPTEEAVETGHAGREGIRLLTWGDPYLTAWLEALQGEPLTQEDYPAAGAAGDPLADCMGRLPSLDPSCSAKVGE
jgi:ERCC4-related helicase